MAQLRHTQSSEMMLNGEGARQFGGRWNSPGVRAVYCSQSIALATLEILVHVPKVVVLTRYRYLEIEVPDGHIESIDESKLNRVKMIETGDRHLGPDGVLAFSVASAVIASEINVVLNPDHPRFLELITFGEISSLQIDQRLLLRQS